MVNGLLGKIGLIALTLAATVALRLNQDIVTILFHNLGVKTVMEKTVAHKLALQVHRRVQVKQQMFHNSVTFITYKMKISRISNFMKLRGQPFPNTTCLLLSL